MKNNEDYVISDTKLKELAKFKNFCVHPCFHGLNAYEFEDITEQKISDYDQLLVAFTRLIDAKIDIYPTFGSNVSQMGSIEQFYRKLSKISSLLPLRFALIDYTTHYLAIEDRLELKPSLKNQIPEENLKKENLTRWDAILKTNTGYNYADIPRQFIPVNRILENSTTMTDCEEMMIHLLKWPSAFEYQVKLLEIIALPEGVRGTVSYHKKYVNRNFEENINQILQYGPVSALFWVINCKQIEINEIRKTEFISAYPLRMLQIVGVRTVENNYEIDYIAGRFLQNSNKLQKEEINAYMNLSNSGIDLSLLGQNNGFLFVGPKMTNIETNSYDMPVESLFEIIDEIDPIIGQTSKIHDYPIIKIKNIEKNDLISSNDCSRCNMRKSIKKAISYSKYPENTMLILFFIRVISIV